MKSTRVVHETITIHGIRHQDIFWSSSIIICTVHGRCWAANLLEWDRKWGDRWKLNQTQKVSRRLYWAPVELQKKKNNKHKNQTEYSLYAVRGALLLGSAVDSGDEGLALSSTTPNTATVMIVMLKYNYLNRH